MGDIELKTYLIPELVVFLDGESRDEVIASMVERVDSFHAIREKDSYLSALQKREGVISTGIGMGVAIPHAKLDSFSDFFIAIGIKQHGSGIDWDSLDGSPVRIVFLIGGPKQQQTEYLKLLSQLTGSIKNEEKRKLLLAAQSPQEVIEILCKSQS